MGWQPPDAIAPPRYALGVDGVGAVRPGACDGASNESCVRIGRRRVEQRLIWRVLRVGGGRAWRRGSVEAAERGGGAEWEAVRDRTAGVRVLNGLGIVAGYRE